MRMLCCTVAFTEPAWQELGLPAMRPPLRLTRPGLFQRQVKAEAAEVVKLRLRKLKGRSECLSVTVQTIRRRRPLRRVMACIRVRGHVY